MKTNKHKLQIIVMILGLVVTFQAIYIVDFFKKLQIQTSQQTQQFSQEILTQAQQEAQEFLTQKTKTGKAKFRSSFLYWFTGRHYYRYKAYRCTNIRN